MAAVTGGPGPITERPIEVDQDNQDHDDSAYDSETASYTTSVASSALDYTIENGRRYHAYREGSYVFPNDEQEQERLDLIHRMFIITLGEKHFLAPIKDPKRILDIGTGTGIWAVEVAEDFPNATVIGNDLSAIQPKWVPPNLSFEIDDCESEWNYSTKFDFIHTRHMDFSIANWEKLMLQCFEYTKPGGWCEWQEGNNRLYSDDESFKKGCPLDRWCDDLFESSGKMNREPNPGLYTEDLARKAGFINIHHQIFKIPVGPWAKDRKFKEMGAFNLAGLLEGLEGFSMALFTRILGRTPEEIQVNLMDIRKMLKDPKIHTLYDFHVVYGQKPE